MLELINFNSETNYVNLMLSLPFLKLFIIKRNFIAHHNTL